jgi:hypothetical protein
MRKLLRGLRGAGGAGAVTGACRVRPGRDVLSAVRDGRCVLLDLRSEQYLGLDEVGTLIWTCMEAGAAVDEVVERLSAEYDAPRAVLEADAGRFVEDLLRRRLVVHA